MTIEVRQLLVKAAVSGESGSGEADRDEDGDRQQLKEEILAECQEWLSRKLQDARER